MKRYSALGVLILSTLMVGCHSSSSKKEADFFAPARDQAQIEVFADRQAIAAAQTDASLYPDHFTGAGLNSLGRQKLDMIFKCAARTTTRIYLADDADSPAHRRAVEQYLASCGWKAEQFSLVAGANPDSHTSAKESLDALDNLDKAGGSSSGGTGSSAGMGLSSAGGGK